MSATSPAARGGTVLLVDDDESLLSALSRVLRPDGLRVLTAQSGERALNVLETEAESVNVVVSDYAMPGMNGVDLLRAVRLRWPDSTRILATGNADLTAAARAVNEGQVARLITKPCDPEQFREIVGAALAQFQLVEENRRLRQVADEQAARLAQWTHRLEDLVNQRTAELEQANASLERGLFDTVRLLVGFLERRLPERANRCREVARLAGRLAERAGVPSEILRRIQVAALVHDIGLMGLPDPIVRQRPEDMPHAARVQYEQHAIIGQSMLSAVEQLVEIARWIRHHHERWDGHGYPDRLSGVGIPLASRIIALADGYIEAVGREGATAARWRSAQRAAGAFDPDLVDILAAELGEVATIRPTETETHVTQLKPGLRLLEPIVSVAGAVLVNSGEILSAELVARIQALATAGHLASAKIAVLADRV